MEIGKAAEELVNGLMLMPWGQVSASVYETGRLVTLAPWLEGHRERIDYLLEAQRSDGSWGAPGGYGLVPTLSATEALLRVQVRGDTHPAESRLRPAADRGLRVLDGLLAEAGSLPDTPAIEYLVPAMLAQINDHLPDPLPLPAGMSYERLHLVRSWIETGADVPVKLLHALEIAGPAASGAPAVRPTPIGTVGASPAATAAWLGDGAGPESFSTARGHLEALARRHGGPMPVGVPITVFERGWVLSWLMRAGVPVDVPPEMVSDLWTAIGPAGTPAGAGLPADADTTSVALYALALLGTPCDPECLWAFHAGTHFSTWLGEDGASVSVNAHVLDAFGAYVAQRPSAAARYGQAMRDLSAWIRARQQPDGSWSDRWHASGYYATVACALALDEYGGPESAPAVDAAVEWVLSTQRADGSWGRWGGTAEETAYAVMVLRLVRGGDEPRRARAVARGLVHLAQASDHPPLWHDKDLYTPLAVVHAAIIASSHLALQ